MAGIDELEMQTDVDELIESLTRSLEDGDWKVREAAAEALGKISNPRVVEPLIKVLDDEDDNVRYAASVRLVRLVNQRSSR